MLGGHDVADNLDIHHGSPSPERAQPLFAIEAHLKQSCLSGILRTERPTRSTAVSRVMRTSASNGYREPFGNPLDRPRPSPSPLEPIRRQRRIRMSATEWPALTQPRPRVRFWAWWRRIKLFRDILNYATHKEKVLLIQIVKDREIPGIRGFPVKVLFTREALTQRPYCV
jgi:hypothetical protein